MTTGPDEPDEPEDLSVMAAAQAVEDAEYEDRPPAMGPLGNAVVATVVLGIGVATLVGSIALGTGTAARPGPGTWPLLVSAVLVVLGVVLLATARRSADAERFTRTAWLVVAGVATMVGFVAVIEVVGFEIPAALLCFVWLRFLGKERWLTSALVTLGVVAAFYLIFVAALNVPIPHLF